METKICGKKMMRRPDFITGQRRGEEGGKRGMNEGRYINGKMSNQPPQKSQPEPGDY